MRTHEDELKKLPRHELVTLVIVEVNQHDETKKALAESQAREAELRAAVKVIANRDSAPSMKEVAYAALARPVDDSALREFGLRVSKRLMLANGWNMNDAETAVDAVLRGER